MREEYRDVVFELSVRLIASYCGISPTRLMAFLFLNHELPEDTKKILDFLTEVVGHLRGAYKKHSGDVFKWFMRKRKRLGNFSPHDLLTAQRDYLFISHAQKILDLARGVNSDAA